jgi:hypothetical protein
MKKENYLKISIYTSYDMKNEIEFYCNYLEQRDNAYYFFAVQQLNPICIINSNDKIILIKELSQEEIDKNK